LEVTELWSQESLVRFGDIDWEQDVPGIQARERSVQGRRWAVVEYARAARRREWCLDGHVGYVLEGAIEYEFDDGGEVLTAGKGEAFCLSTGRAHRGRNLAASPTRLFLIDDEYRA
jgi:quercetin dioxygenase-like cupin family protein